MILIDTHIWVWWLSNPEKLSPVARNAVQDAARKRSIYVSSISAWEIALLVSNERLSFTMDAQDWIARAEGLPFFHFIPVDNAIAVRSVRLEEPFHKDPADRIIVATAITMGIPLVSSDTKLLKYPHVKTIWN